MKAIVQDAYGHLWTSLNSGNIDMPTVENDRVLVRVKAASINPLDWHLVRGAP
jgi:NADPH:quinone reductase-like Zn-dependent oxidoreductase